MKHGEIRWYRFLVPGKKRPVLVLTRDSVLEYLGEVTIAPITTTVRDIPSEVFLSTTDGMPRDCTINCDHLQTVSNSAHPEMPNLPDIYVARKMLSSEYQPYACGNILRAP
ncbi:MAG: PemK family transcriptional regulator [Deltaproteobacteria bacterium]|nr:MAG: PemK family transcriptional regulator [Deltaproteobacteria bacterium]